MSASERLVVEGNALSIALARSGSERLTGLQALLCFQEQLAALAAQAV